MIAAQRYDRSTVIAAQRYDSSVQERTVKVWHKRMEPPFKIGNDCIAQCDTG